MFTQSKRRRNAMQKRSVIWLTLTLSVLLTLIIACEPATPRPNPTTSTGVMERSLRSAFHILAPTNVTHPVATVPAGENLYVLDGYTPLGANSTGGKQIVAFHPGSANPATRIILPTGLTS